MSGNTPNAHDSALRSLASKTVRLSVWCLFALVLLTSGASAQSNTQGTSVINGTVVDPNGSIVQNATVIVNGKSGMRISATTRATRGGFAVTGLAPGKYPVEASAQGFSRATRTLQLSGDKPE